MFDIFRYSYIFVLVWEAIEKIGDKFFSHGGDRVVQVQIKDFLRPFSIIEVVAKL